MAFLRVISLLGRYGPRAVNWAWANKGTILRWIAGGGVSYAVEMVLRHLGI